MIEILFIENQKNKNQLLYSQGPRLGTFQIASIFKWVKALLYISNSIHRFTSFTTYGFFVNQLIN
jgi:hypothetical protein